MKLRFNFRLVFLLVMLIVLAIREVALELRPAFLRPGLHLYAYVGNTGDGTISVIDPGGLCTPAVPGMGIPGIRPACPTRPS